ncbi:MAG: VWA domain-containing protein [Chloroflexota bacterium]
MNTNDLKFQLDSDLDLVSQEMISKRTLKISIQAPTGNLTDRPRLNLALVLDRSGSMSGDKLTHVKQAAVHVLNMLQEQDTIALVAYDDAIDLLAPSTPVTDSIRKQIKERISRLEPGGSTNLSGGWLAGCREAASAAREGTVNRTLLLTDGQANAGIQDLEELSQHARELSRRGVTTSTFGVGEGFNEHLLEAMSNQGNGNFYYIDHPRSIPDLFMREFKELAAITARDVEIDINFPADWYLQVPGGWRTQFSEGRLRIFVGNLFSNQTQEIYIRMTIPVVNHLKNSFTLQANLSGKSEKDLLFEGQANLTYQSATQINLSSAHLKSEVITGFAQVYLAEIAIEALKLERSGENQRAGFMLNQAIQEYINFISPEETDKFKRMADRMIHGMDEMDRKMSHSNSYNQKRGKQ